MEAEGHTPDELVVDTLLFLSARGGVVETIYDVMYETH
jgi:hypothetical protein